MTPRTGGALEEHLLDERLPFLPTFTIQAAWYSGPLLASSLRVK